MTSPERAAIDIDPTDGGPTSSGQHRLRVDPSAIPRLRASFERALDQLRPQVHSAITDLRVRPWAGDPVSDAAAEQFNQSSLDDGEGAYHALRSYQEQLRAAAEALHTAHHEYRTTDEAGQAEFHPLS